MDFFEHQEKARKNSGILIFYFFLAVAGIILAVYALVTGLSFFVESKSSATPGSLEIWRPDLFALTAMGTGTVIFLASAYKTMQLSGGGKVVAMELGGRVLDVHTTDFHERRLLNIVEEMAIASGVPVPDVYVMDSEDSINAFAAGKTTSDAVIGVTRGCMKMLTRDELQGVIAHEFSHILNGDMRLNMRLIGMLFGILFLTLIGEMIMRSTFYTRSSRDRDSGGGVIAILIAGIGLMIIGYIGMFFANLIKASISRQREFLADASAVQFTRNPDGIAGALKKIGALSEGSSITHPMARDASHLFFGSAFRQNAFATHPPLQIRIKRLLPHWNGDFGSAKLAPITERSEPSGSQQTKKPGGILFPTMLAGGNLAEMHLSESEAAESMRSVHVEQVSLGKGILKDMPEHWAEAVYSEPGAQAVIFALLLAQDEQLRDEELSHIRKQIDQLTYKQVVLLHSELSHLHSAVKLALIDLCIPAMRRLSPAEYERFRKIVNGLVASDRMVDLFEFTLQKVVSRHLDTYFHVTRPPRIRYRNIGQLTTEAAVLISTLSAFSNPENEKQIRSSFKKGSDHIRALTGRSLEFQSAENCSLDAIREAIHRFEESTPIIKRELLLAASKAVLADGKISSNEAELIRAIADAMGCAIPPFVRTAPLAD
ncbi:MAG: M48 family metallopeptidase [Verrucomicrobiales bacterium]|nr:M48 family metallopeptidase [Verrucomicrobiales bacterium]